MLAPSLLIFIKFGFPVALTLVVMTEAIVYAPLVRAEQPLYLAYGFAIATALIRQ